MYPSNLYYIWRGDLSRKERYIVFVTLCLSSDNITMLKIIVCRPGQTEWHSGSKLEGCPYFLFAWTGDLEQKIAMFFSSFVKKHLGVTNPSLARRQYWRKSATKSDRDNHNPESKSCYRRADDFPSWYVSQMLLKSMVIVFSNLQGIVDRIAKPLSKSKRFHEGHLELWHVGGVLDVA